MAEGRMKVVGSLLALLTVLAIGYFIFKAQFTKGPQQGAPPMEQIDVVGVTTDLQAIAQAERMYLATHGAYATVDQLQQDGSITFSSNRRGYTYVADLDDGQHFKVTARPVDPSKQSWPTLAIDETMQVSRQ
jgi:hypothetical protein